MPNTPGMSTSFKGDLLNGLHAFGASVIRAATTKDVFNVALYTTGANITVATTAYTPTGEASGTGYSAGGIALTNGSAPTINGTSYYWTPSASAVWSGLTAGPFDTCLVYNNTATGKNAVASFGLSTQSITAGTLTLTMPSQLITIS